MAPQKEYDYIIVGGGTAGCVMASRLSFDPAISVLVIEGGPDDRTLPQVLQLKDWLSLMHGPLDYGYKTVPQPRGNSHIVHSRARVLGGCSSHNTLISFFPFPQDLDDWVAAGAKGWSWSEMAPYARRLQCRVQPVAHKDRNALANAFVDSTKKALGLPEVKDFANWMKRRDPHGFSEGVGWLSIAYTPEDGKRQSSSVAYMHDIMDKRRNLEIWFEAFVRKIEFSGKRATGVEVQLKSGERVHAKARREVLLCAGAIDSPRLLLLSGVGPRQQLEKLGIPVLHELPGVGENLLDHPETIIMWKTEKHPPETVMKSDAAYFNRRAHLVDPNDPRPDMMSHTYQVPFADNTERHGYLRPEHAFCITPNIPRPRSRGRIYLTTSDPNAHPALDFCYFTDEGNYDAKCLVDGLKQARKIAAEEPLKKWLQEEVAPGPHVQTDEELDKYARKVAHTVYHPAGTCKMGAPKDKMAVVDPQLRVQGLSGLRIADASIFPTMVTPNPMITVFMIGEKASDLVLMDHYRESSPQTSRL